MAEETINQRRHAAWLKSKAENASWSLLEANATVIAAAKELAIKDHRPLSKDQLEQAQPEP